MKMGTIVKLPGGRIGTVLFIENGWRLQDAYASSFGVDGTVPSYGNVCEFGEGFDAED